MTRFMQQKAKAGNERIMNDKIPLLPSKLHIVTRAISKNGD